MVKVILAVNGTLKDIRTVADAYGLKDDIIQSSPTPRRGIYTKS